MSATASSAHDEQDTASSAGAAAAAAAGDEVSSMPPAAAGRAAIHQHSSANGAAPGQLSRQVSGVRAEDSAAGLAASKSTNIIAVDAGGSKLKRGGFMVSHLEQQQTA